MPGTAEQFIREQLLKPMQITNYHWQEDLSGFPKSAGLSFLSRDMMKMGLLTLNGGKWHGKQHLPKEFVKTATSTFDPHKTDQPLWLLLVEPEP